MSSTALAFSESRLAPLPGCFDAAQSDREVVRSSSLPLSEGLMPHDRERVSGNSLGRDSRNIPAFELTHGDFLKKVAKAFHDHVGNAASPAKVLAEEIECSDKTTRSWLDGKTAPSGLLDLRAMNRIPAYAALKRKLAAQESALDPRVQQTVQQLHALTLALANGEGL